jgi:hypothetical protein
MGADRRTKERLMSLGLVLTVLRRGTRAAAARGCWRLAKLETGRTAQDWTLWSSSSEASQERQKQRLGSIRLTNDGVIPLDPACPSAREVLRGPMASAYAYEGVVVATDGSLKHDGAMGAAFVALGCLLSPPPPPPCLSLLFSPPSPLPRRIICCMLSPPPPCGCCLFAPPPPP